MTSEPINSKDPYGLASMLDETLARGDYKEALVLVDDPQHNEYFEDGSAWDLIPIVSKYITQEIVDKSADLFQCCEVLFEEIAKRAHVEEALLEFIELVECAENSVLFTAVLKPMQTCLKRKVPRANFLLYCLNAIESHMSDLSVPDAIRNRECGNKDLSDVDSECKEMTKLYVSVRTFYRPFLLEITVNMKMPESPERRQALEERNNLICFLLHLLGKPLAAFNMSDSNPKTTARAIAENVVFDLTCLCSNVLMFLEYAELRAIQEQRNFEYRPSPGEDCFDLFLLQNKVPTFSIGILFNLIFVEEIALDRVPCVYNPIYILQISLYLTTKLLEESDCHVIEKALKLSDKVLCHIQDFEIPSVMLELPRIENWLQVVTFTIIYCSFTELRKLALKVFRTFILKFDCKGRYLLLCNIHRCINHDGLFGILIDELKGMINGAISSYPEPSHFSGSQLFPLLRLYCTLPDIKDKNLLEVSSQVTASLNLLRFFVIRDKENITGIWEHLDYFERFLFEPLTSAIDLSRESNKAEMQRIMEERNQPPEEPKENSANMSVENKMSVTVRGKEIPAPSNNDEINAEQIHSSLTVLDMMASLLFRLKECIQYNKSLKL